MPKQNRQAMAQALGANLRRLTLEKGWRQTDLATAASKHMPVSPSTLVSVPLTRQQINTYWQGKVLPGRIVVKALADALHVTQRDLVPSLEMPEIATRASGTLPASTAVIEQIDERTALVRVSQVVPWQTALKIMELLKGDK